MTEFEIGPREALQQLGSILLWRRTINGTVFAFFYDDSKNKVNILKFTKDNMMVTHKIIHDVTNILGREPKF